MSRRNGKSVLCIGSEPVSLNLRCSLLSGKGWAVSAAGSGHEGVLRFERQPVDAVVVDLDDTGIESALIISALKKIRPDVATILLVADPAKLAAGAASQADAVLAKFEESSRLADILTGLTRRE
jgi:CheY-like chemotaxis protein